MMMHGQQGQYMGDSKAMHRKSDSLRKFTGNAENYSSWSQHIVDHMSKVHPYWRYTLNWLAKTEMDISFQGLQGQTLGPLGEDAVDLATKFE